MFAKLASVVALAVLGASAVPNPEARAATVIASGTSLQTGPIAQKPWYYWADATIDSGVCPAAIAAEIPDCYSIFLPQAVNKGQKGQFRTPLSPADGSTYWASWTSNIPSANINVTGNALFHLFEMYSTEGGSFAYVWIKDNNVYLTSPDGTVSDPTPLFGFTDRNAFHQVLLKTGPQGHISFNVTDKVTGDRLLTYNYSGKVGTKDFQYRVGSYRDTSVGQTQFTEHIGEWDYYKV